MRSLGATHNVTLKTQVPPPVHLLIEYCMNLLTICCVLLVIIFPFEYYMFELRGHYNEIFVPLNRFWLIRGRGLALSR